MTPTTYTRDEVLLNIEHVSHTFGQNEALRDINVKIRNLKSSDPTRTTGQVIAFLGPSGCGKSTLLRIIAGLDAPTVGQVRIDPDAKPIKRGTVGVVFQKYPLFEHRTVFGNLVIAGELAGMKYLAAKEQTEYYLDLFEMTQASEKYPVELSRGMQQRVAISQQLMNMDGQSETYTRLMLMDEPFAALDHRNCRKTCSLVRKVADLHDTNTIIVVTHDISAALCIGDIVWVMGREKDENGKVCSGGKIVKELDLISAGLTWQPDIDTLPAFAEVRRELAGMFQTL